MDPKRLACGSLLLHLLIVLGTCDFVAAVQEMQKMHDHHSHSPSHMMQHMDPAANVFFVLDDLKLGKTMPIFFADGDPNPLSSPYLLAKEKADAIPFSLEQLANILEYFSFPQKSRKSQVMENTLQECETKPIKGETKFCATSYKSLVDFARKILGLETNIEVLSTHHPIRSNVSGLQNYTIIEAPERISTPKMVACHTMPYPYIVFYCHSQEGDNRVYRTFLLGENADRVEAIAVCHMDTSQWNRDHVSFRVLGIEPGTAPVCHFFPADNFVLVPSTSAI